MLRYPLDEQSELRLLQINHAEMLFDLVDRNRGHLRRWLSWVDQTHSPAEIATFIRSRLEALARNEGYTMGIWHGGKIAGSVDLFDCNGIRGEIGYWLGQNFEGRGLMTKSVKALLGYAFDELGLARVQIKVHPDNLRSRAVPERLGFTLEGTLRNDYMLHGRLVDHVLYSITPEDWANQPQE